MISGSIYLLACFSSTPKMWNQMYYATISNFWYNDDYIFSFF